MSEEHQQTHSRATDVVTETRNLPLVSIIMPVRNEQEVIRRSLSAVLLQDYPSNRMEVLIVDGLSDDDTRAIVSEMSEHDSRVKVIDNEARLMAAGFNRGLSFARGEVILMLGGHTEIADSYLSRCVGILREKRADCVGGVIETQCETEVGKAIALAMSSSFGVGGVNFRIGASEEKYVDTVAFGAYTREIIERAGRLDESLVRNQDDEYNYRIRKLGARILLVPDLHCRYYSRSSLAALWHQYFQYGYWKVRVTQKHPRQMRPRHFVPMLFVGSLLLSLGLAPFAGVGLRMFGVILGLYIAANLAASISLALKRNRHLLALLPLCFAVLHISYGLGFLIGLVVFWRHWSRDGDRLDRDKLLFRGAKQV
jgi:glycosyltransferase involved in cell wall biosynthesis